MRGVRFYVFVLILLLTILSGVVVYLYYTISYSSADLLGVIPNKEAVAIIRFKNLTNLEKKMHDTSSSQNELFKNILFSESSSLVLNMQDFVAELKDSIQLQDFKDRPFVISSYYDNDLNGSALSVFKIKNRLEKSKFLKAFSKRNELSQSTSYLGCSIYQLKISTPTQPLFFAFNEGFLFLSYNRKLIERCVDQQLNSSDNKQDTTFTRLVKLNRNIDSDNLFLNISKIKFCGIKGLNSQWPNYLSQIDSSRGWADYDIDYKDNYLNFSGIILDNGTNSLTPLFLSGSGNLSLDKIYPASTYSLLNYTFNTKNFENIFCDFILNKSLSDSCKLLFPNQSKDEVSENLRQLSSSFDGVFGVGFFGNGPSVNEIPVLFTQISNASQFLNKLRFLKEKMGIELDVEDTQILDSETKLTIFKGIPSSLMDHLFGSFFSSVPSKYMAFIDGYWVVADSKERLVSVFQDYLVKNTLSNNPDFKRYRGKFSDNENIFVYTVSSTHSFLHKNFSPTDSTFKEYNVVLGQQIAVSGGVTYSSVVFDYNVKSNTSVNFVWKSHLDSVIIIDPQVLISPKSDEKVLIVQDSKYVVYLINSIGRILWQRPIDGKIQSSIIQQSVKGKYQNSILFNTVDKIYQLDFDGNNIGNFPVLLPSSASCGLALFDYEKNGDFRLFVPSIDKQIRVFDKKGNLVVGFKAKDFEGRIDSPIQHFSIDDKDYIVFSDGLTSFILDRKGNDRIVVGVPFEQNIRSAFHYVREGKLNYFVTSNVEGDVVKISIPSGETTIVNGVRSGNTRYFSPIDLGKDGLGYLFVTTAKIHLLSADGTEIYSKSLYAESTSDIKIERNGNNKLFLSFIDIDKSQFYVLDVLTGNPILGYPKYGELGHLLDFDKSGNVITYVGSNDNSLIHY